MGALFFEVNAPRETTDAAESVQAIHERLRVTVNEGGRMCFCNGVYDGCSGPGWEPLNKPDFDAATAFQEYRENAASSGGQNVVNFIGDKKK